MWKPYKSVPYVEPGYAVGLLMGDKVTMSPILLFEQHCIRCANATCEIIVLFIENLILNPIN